jgi:hypothetical protein
MKYLIYYLTILNFCILNLNAQVTKADYYNKINNKVFTFSKQKPDAVFDTITAFVNGTFQSQEDRARAYYTWIALNINYDEDYRGSISYSLIKDIRNENNVSMRVNNIIETKLGASESIANLFSKFCQSSKITCFTVPGYIKRPNRTVSDMLFVWNVLYLDSIWFQVDASMHHGYLNENYKFVRHPMPDFFCNKPSDFITSHFPHDPMWQLLEYPCNISEFIKERIELEGKLAYNFEDSLKNYSHKTMSEQKEIDIIRYFKNETIISLYDKNLELYNYDKAADKMELGIKYFDQYFEIGKNKLSKYPLKSDWKIAKEYLNKSELYFNETEKLLNAYILKRAETNQIYNILHSNLKGNLSDVYKNQEYLEKLKPFLKEK